MQTTTHASGAKKRLQPVLRTALICQITALALTLAAEVRVRSSGFSNGDDRRKALASANQLELITQIVESASYVGMFMQLVRADGTNHTARRIAMLRYADWAITTPIMLVTTSRLLAAAEPGGSAPHDITCRVFAMNALMLSAGFVWEIAGDWIDDRFTQEAGSNVHTVLAIKGFVLLGYVFHEGFATALKTAGPLGYLLFVPTVLLWSLYGAVFCIFRRNWVGRAFWYAILDVLSKNANAVVASVAILSLSPAKAMDSSGTKTVVTKTATVAKTATVSVRNPRDTRFSVI